MKKNLFTLHGLMVGVLVGFIAFIIRYLFVLYFYIDLLDILSNTYESLIYYLGIGGLRYIIREVLDNIVLKMDDNPNGSGVDQHIGDGVQPQVGGQIPATKGYLKTPIGHGQLSYIVDPTGVGSQGYLNPDTGKPFTHSFQPFASNLVNAMEDQSKQRRSEYFTWMNSEYDNASNRFFKEFMRHNFPKREPCLYKNSGRIRDMIRRLP